MAKKKAPIDLQSGDMFETAWGDIEIQERRGETFEIFDPTTGEQTELSHDDLIAIMQGNL